MLMRQIIFTHKYKESNISLKTRSSNRESNVAYCKLIIEIRVFRRVSFDLTITGVSGRYFRTRRFQSYTYKAEVTCATLEV